MNAYVYLALSVLVFLILATYWKSKNVVVLLMLFAGNILSATSSGWLASRVNEAVDFQSVPIANIVKSVLLLLPPIIALLLTKGGAKKKHLIINLLSGSITSVLSYLWFLRTLPFDQFSRIESEILTRSILIYRDAIISVGVLLALIYLILDKKKKEVKHKSKKD